MTNLPTIYASFDFHHVIQAWEQSDCQDQDSRKPMLSEIHFLEFHLGDAVEHCFLLLQYLNLLHYC